MTNKKQEETQNYIVQQLMGQQLQQIEQQIATIEAQAEELENIKESLSELQKHDKKTIHTPLGAGVFLESELRKPDDVLLNVGSGVIVKRSTQDALRIISNQIDQLKKIKEQMQNEYTKLIEGMRELK